MLARMSQSATAVVSGRLGAGVGRLSPSAATAAVAVGPPGSARPRVMLERVPHVKATPKPERCVRPVPAADAGPPNCQPGPLSAETSTTRQSPRAGPCRPRSQSRRHACQSGRLASTSPAGASTPCAVSSVAVEAPCCRVVRCSRCCRRSVAEPMSNSPLGRIFPVLAYVDENTSSRLRATTYLAGLSRTARALKCALPHSLFAFSLSRRSSVKSPLFVSTTK